MTRLAANEARKKFSRALDRVSGKGERIVIQRRGKDAAVLVPLEDLALIESVEDQIDIDAARKALREPGGISLADLKRKYGL